MLKFYKCAHCGQIVLKVKETAVPVVCCGQPMQQLLPNTTDAANEKHVPVVSVNGNVVKVVVGEVEHPMLDVHYIEWIILETNLGYHQAKLNLAILKSFRQNRLNVLSFVLKPLSLQSNRLRRLDFLF